MLRLKRSLCGETQPLQGNAAHMGLFFRKETKFSVRIRNSKIFEKQQNLPKHQNLSSNEIQTGKSLGLFPEKEAHMGCVCRQKLRFKRSKLLGNLIGPSYLELRV